MLVILKDKPETFEWKNVTKTAVKNLGIYTGHEKIECYNKDWIKTIMKWKNYLNHGKDENFLCFGKCTIINTLALA